MIQNPVRVQPWNVLGEAVYLRSLNKVNIKEIVLTVEGDEYPCPNCKVQIDDCQCACPYCAEVEECDCAIGHDKATGG